MTSLKKEMGLASDLIYMNHASIGPLPQSSFDILYSESKKQLEVGEKKIFYEEIEILWDNLQKNASKIVNGNPDGITITTNTASGLHVVADCLYNQFKKGKNIVLPNIEFITNSFIWQQVAKRYNVELRMVKFDIEENYYYQWEKLIDSNTVLVVLSHVQFSNGFRSDLKRITKIAHECGSYVCVDAIQSLGAVPFYAKEWDVDFVAAASYKWMMGPQGSGLLYMKPELAENLESILVGWFSTPNFKNLGHHDFIPWNNGRKFQQSMINPVLNSFNESLKTVISWEPRKSYSKILHLLDILVKEIESLKNFSIGSSLSKETRSGILKINSIQDSKELVNYLGTKNITVSYRDGGIRVSPHAYNDKNGIESLLSVLSNWRFN